MISKTDSTFTKQNGGETDSNGAELTNIHINNLSPIFPSFHAPLLNQSVQWFLKNAAHSFRVLPTPRIEQFKFLNTQRTVLISNLEFLDYKKRMEDFLAKSESASSDEEGSSSSTVTKQPLLSEMMENPLENLDLATKQIPLKVPDMKNRSKRSDPMKTLRGKILDKIKLFRAAVSKMDNKQYEQFLSTNRGAFGDKASLFKRVYSESLSSREVYLKVKFGLLIKFYENLKAQQVAQYMLDLPCLSPALWSILLARVSQSYLPPPTPEQMELIQLDPEYQRRQSEMKNSIQFQPKQGSKNKSLSDLDQLWLYAQVFNPKTGILDFLNAHCLQQGVSFDQDFNIPRISFSSCVTHRMYHLCGITGLEEFTYGLKSSLHFFNSLVQPLLILQSNMSVGDYYFYLSLRKANIDISVLPCKSSTPSIHGFIEEVNNDDIRLLDLCQQEDYNYWNIPNQRKADPMFSYAKELSMEYHKKLDSLKEVEIELENDCTDERRTQIEIMISDLNTLSSFFSSDPKVYIIEDTKIISSSV